MWTTHKYGVQTLYKCHQSWDSDFEEIKVTRCTYFAVNFSLLVKHLEKYLRWLYNATNTLHVEVAVKTLD